MSEILRHKLVEYKLLPDAEGYVKLSNFLKLIHALVKEIKNKLI
jgi:RNA:NAD 2'-phosphotransferase (TPT1/KptA family)